jgi:PAS domain S-box-containing protein
MQVSQQQIQQSEFVLFSNFILERKEEITKRWSKVIYDEVNLQAAYKLTHMELVAPLATLISGISQQLHQYPDLNIAAAIKYEAEQHGHTRFQQGYAIDDLLQELGVLRILILEEIDLFSQQGLPIDRLQTLEIRKLIHKFLNGIFFTAARQFSDEQRLEARHYREELEKTNLRIEETVTRLSVSEEKFRATFEQAPVGVAHFSIDGKWLQVNRKFCDIVGFTYTELIRRTFQDITYSEDIDADLDFINQMLSGEISSYSLEKRYMGKNDLIIWVNLTVSLVRGNSDKPQYFIAIIQDITDRKRLERELQAQITEAVNANRAKDEIISIVSHELRSPLTAALGWAHLLKTGKLDPGSADRAAAIIERNIKAQERLINDLLDVGRIITDKMALYLSKVEVIKIVENAAETIEPLAEEKNIKIVTSLDPMLAPIFADSSRLQQVLLNLLTNAVKFTPNGGQINIELTQTASHVQMTISDTGKGIKPDFLPYIFDRFRQEERGLKSKHGLGLGLSIARHIVELHGGTIIAQSEGEGEGSTFIVSLPKSA